jgi:hypothetical protein
MRTNVAQLSSIHCCIRAATSGQAGGVMPAENG